jgi:DMATS type aromatic prenyltransferase
MILIRVTMRSQIGTAGALVNALSVPSGLTDRSLFDVGAERLRALSEALGFRDSRPIVDLFHRLLMPWGDRALSEGPPWPSDVGDDHTPFEFSLALGGAPELRVMVEPLGDAPSLRSNAAASLALLASLGRDFDVDMTRIDRVKDLFLPRAPSGVFAAWVAAEFSAARDPKFKVYLNPYAQGRQLAPALIEEALVRLGFPTAWAYVAQILSRRGPDLDELMYFSLDVSHSSESRLKVYARHRRCTPADLEAAAAGSPTHRPGDVARFLEIVAPDVTDVFRGRAPFNCYAFAGGSNRPMAVTTHFPINGYAAHDGVVRERVLEYLRYAGIPEDDYSRALRAFANRPLDGGIGLQSYVSFRRHHGKPRLTVYLPVEAYRPGKVANAPATLRPLGVGDIPSRLAEAAIGDDPFLRRLHREPPDLQRFRILCANYALGAGIPRLLADAARGVVGDDIGHLATSPLPSDRGVSADAGGRASGETAISSGPEEIDARLQTPGKALAGSLAEFCKAADRYEALGAWMACDVIRRQMSAFVSDEVRRYEGLDVLHVGIGEPDAASSPLDLATLAPGLPEDAVEGTWRGARRFWYAMRTFLNELYGICYC